MPQSSSDSEVLCSIGCGGIGLVLLFCLRTIPLIMYYENVDPTVCTINAAEAVFFENSIWTVRAEATEFATNQTRTLREPCTDSGMCELLVEEEYMPIGRMIECTMRPTSILVPNKSAYTRYPVPWWYGDIIEVILESIALLFGILLLGLLICGLCCN